jgi:brefeldin A-inhibited guanine nucleotide-exchange protein
MLNTDAHNPQVKHRMTMADFVKNNRGINDGEDLPEELLSGIYDEIVNNEIRMKDELDAALGQPTASGPGIAGALVTVGRDLQREAYMLQSSGMANKTEVSRASLLTTNQAHRHVPTGAFQDINALAAQRFKIGRPILQRIALCPRSTHV